jgi:WD40 repeat protein
MEVLKGHAGSVVAVAYSANGTYLASGSRDRTVRLWESATGLEHVTLKAHSAAVTSVSFSQDGTLLASASFDGTIKLWQL